MTKTYNNFALLVFEDCLICRGSDSSRAGFKKSAITSVRTAPLTVPMHEYRTDHLIAWAPNAVVALRLWGGSSAEPVAEFYLDAISASLADQIMDWYAGFPLPTNELLDLAEDASAFNVAYLAYRSEKRKIST